jgi:transposase
MPVRSYVREEGWLLPASLDELIAPDDPVRFVAGYIDGMTDADLERLEIRPTGAQYGAPSYHPRLLLGIWVWAFMCGIRSTRQIEQACRRRTDFLWLTGMQCPDHNTLWRFYERYRTGMRQLLRESVALALHLGLVDLAIQAVDGTKVAGNAARDRTYDHAGLDALLARTERAIAELEAQNRSDDDPAPPRMPGDLADAHALRDRITAAKAALGEEGQINLTDADARLLPSRHGWLAGYNCQAVASPLDATVAGQQGQLITAACATTAANDKDQLVPMIEAAAANTGMVATVTVADGSYQSMEALMTCQEREYTVLLPIDAPRTAREQYHQAHFDYDAASETYRCPEGQTLTFRGMRQRTGREPTRAYGAGAAVCRACPAFGQCTTDGHKGRLIEIAASVALHRQHRARMDTAQAKALYARRKTLIEPVFGILKEPLGLRRLLLRGLEQVDAEWQFLAACFNLRVLARIWQQRPQLFAA